MSDGHAILTPDELQLMFENNSTDSSWNAYIPSTTVLDADTLPNVRVNVTQESLPYDAWKIGSFWDCRDQDYKDHDAELCVDYRTGGAEYSAIFVVKAIDTDSLVDSDDIPTALRSLATDAEDGLLTTTELSVVLEALADQTAVGLKDE